MSTREMAACSAPRRDFRPAYNLFRRSEHPGLLCAVPENYPVPNFIDGRRWVYVAKLESGSEAPPGFEREVAQGVVPATGFYLFTPPAPAEQRATDAQPRGPEGLAEAHLVRAPVAGASGLAAGRSVA